MPNYNEPLILCAVALPPPVHGMSFINQQVIRHLPTSQIKVINLAAPSLQRGLIYHVTRLYRVIKACTVILANSLNAKPRKLYTALDGGWGGYYTLGITYLAKILGYQVFIHHHAATHTKKQTRSLAAIAALVPHATHIALSEGMKRDLQHHYPRLNTILVSDNACHINMPPAPKTPRSSKGPIKLGMLSNLTVDKGTLLALQAAQQAVSEGLDITLTLAGPIVEDAVKQAIQDAQPILKDRLIIAGPLYGEAKTAFLQNLDVFLFPTLYPIEAQPLVLLEAMSQNCSIIAYGRGYIPELIADECGLCVPLTDSFPKAAVTWLRTRPTKKGKPTASASRYAAMHAESQAQFQALVKRILNV